MYLESIRLLPDNRIYFRYRPNHYRDWRMVFNMKYQRQEQKFTISVILVSIICLGFPRKIYYGHLWDYEKQTFRPFILPWPLNCSVLQGDTGSSEQVHHHTPAPLPPAAAGCLVSGNPSSRQMGRFQKEKHPQPSQFPGCPQPCHSEDRQAWPQLPQVSVRSMHYSVSV